MDQLIHEEFYSSLFVLAGLAFAFLEVFVPSGGVLLALSIASSGFGIYGLFEQGHRGWAWSTIVIMIAIIGASFAWLLRRTRFRGTLTTSTPEMSIDGSQLELEGREGMSLSPLRPSGLALIDGRRIDVVASTGFIEKNRPVRVVETTGNRVVVREVR